MLEFLSIGDTSHNVYLEMTDETAHIVCKKDDENCQLCFSWADKIPVKHLYDTSASGNSANAAVSFARLGHSSALYAHVGGDEEGQRSIRTLKGENINTDYIVADADKITNFSTVLMMHGERSILVYHEHRHYVFPKAEPSVWTYLSSMGEGSASIFPDIIRYVQETGSKLCYQPGTFQLKMGIEPTRELLKNTHIFMVNKEEAELYLNREPTDDFRSLLDGVRELGPHIALITDGRKGAYVSDGMQYIFLGIIEEAPRNEATGAGDSFSSAFTAALQHGKSLGEAMLWGQAQASSVIQKVGPQAGLLSQAELEAILAKYPDLQPQVMM